MRNVDDGKIFGENAANVKHKPSRVFCYLVSFFQGVDWSLPVAT